MFLENVKKFDIFGMCETWGNATSDFDNTLPDYSHFSYVREKPRTARRNSGGVTVFVKNNLVENGYIKQVFDDIDDCVVLIFDSCCLNVMCNEKYNHDICLCVTRKFQYLHRPAK